ncbi:MAG: MAPEG family protein [Woeseiaceae bacterium]
MKNTLIFQPFFSLIALTLVIWIAMYVKRTSYILAEKLSLRSVDTPAKMDRVVPTEVNLPAYALRNLLELPIIFYVLCLYLFATDSVDQFYLAAAWLFVAGRIIHAAIYCTSNRVMHRFRAYFLSSLILWAMVLRAAYFAFFPGAT